MLELKNIVKDYVTKDLTTHALKGVSVNFRRNEFVSILGSSGCGKTTLLNIIGGLDRYTSGDLIIEGRSTKDYKDRDWDTYRSHSIGFIFQSYNLIMHQNLLNNVELALTIAGVSKKERKERAEKALETVGLGGLGSKKPNQLSGGQMQRVAIARALVNNPEILLADEPTGALDSVTSIQVMDLLKEIAKDRLVIMVTHNPDLAKEYSTRIIKLKDGSITDDSRPFSDEDSQNEVAEFIKKKEKIALEESVQYLDDKSSIKKAKKAARKKEKKSRMTFATALQLSFNNLKTKKGRTILTAIAGSIGIIGIGMILAMSDGFNTYVQRVQSDSLSTLPIALKERDISLANIIAPGQKKDPDQGKYPKDQTVHTKDFLFDAVTRILGTGNRNDLTLFKTYIETEDFKKQYGHLYNSIQYVYDTDINIYKQDTSGLEKTGYTHTFDIDYTPLKNLKNMPSGIEKYLSNLSSKDIGVFSLLINNQKVLDQQYDLLAGSYPTKENEVLIRVDKYNRINDYVYYALGQRNMTEDVNEYNEKDKISDKKISFESIINDSTLQMPLSANLLNRTVETVELFGETIEVVQYKPYDENDSEQLKAKKAAIESAPKFKVAGIVRSKESATSGSINSCIVYTDTFVQDMNKRSGETQYVKEQLAVQPKEITYEGKTFKIWPNLINYKEPFYSETDMKDYVCSNFGYGESSSPGQILIYPKSFAAKDELKNAIYKYNQMCVEKKIPEKQISYTDNLASVTQSLALVIDGVTMVLIGFVSISLVVSSVMIGIITYVSVIERTKEIGVLRSLGASKNNVGNVFNAETFIIGLTSGTIGVLISMIGIIPINIAIATMANIKNLAFLSWYYALALIGISIVLTVIAGLVPARIASKKDPVIALRSGE